MTDFIGELAGKLADRWATTVALPGLAFGGLLYVSYSFHSDPLWTFSELVLIVGRDTEGLKGNVAALVVLAGISLTASLAMGAVVERIAWMIEGSWTARRPDLIFSHLINLRKRRWLMAQAAYEAAAGDREHLVRAIARNRIGLGLPLTPTWIGDRLSHVTIRCHGQYGIDLAYALPRLWLLTSAEQRTEILSYRRDLSTASMTLAWGVACFFPAMLWWPSAGVAFVLIFGGWTSARSAAAKLSDALEAMVDLTVTPLAKALGIPVIKRVSFDEGQEITEVFRKGS